MARVEATDMTSGTKYCPRRVEIVTRQILPILTITISIVFVFIAARAVIGLNLELIEAKGGGSPFRFEEWALIALAPLLLLSVFLQSYFLFKRRTAQR